MRLYLKMRGVGKEERRHKAEEMSQRVQPDHLKNRMPGQLSASQHQRVALADNQPQGAAAR